MSYDVGIIIGNKECKLLGKTPVVFENGVRIRPMKENHLGAVLTKFKGMSDKVTGKTRYILAENVDADIDDAKVDSLTTTTLFSLNFFSVAAGLSISGVFLFREVRRTRIDRAFSKVALQVSAGTGSASFELRNDTQPADIQTLHIKVVNAIEKDPSLLLTLGRFNACLVRGNDQDFIINAAICLESMFSSQTEIVFRFSLYNAIIGVTSLADRMDAFQLLKRVYNLRSSVVHGTVGEATLGDAERTRLLAIMRTAILYRVDYLQNNQRQNWQVHIDRLALGYHESIWAAE